MTEAAADGPTDTDQDLQVFSTTRPILCMIVTLGVSW